MAEGIQGVDILYNPHSGRTISVTAGGGSLSRAVRLNQAVYTQNCAPNTVIMSVAQSSCLAQELDEDLNQNPNLAIFRQTDNGMLNGPVALILDVVDEVDNHAQPVTWYTDKRHR